MMPDEVELNEEEKSFFEVDTRAAYKKMFHRHRLDWAKFFFG